MSTSNPISAAHAGAGEAAAPPPASTEGFDGLLVAMELFGLLTDSNASLESALSFSYDHGSAGTGVTVLLHPRNEQGRGCAADADRVIEREQAPAPHLRA